MKRRSAIWVLAALAGLALAVGVTYAASRLSTQHIGLSSEPLTAGDKLVPRRAASPRPRPRPTRTATPTRTTVPTRTTMPSPRPTVPTSGDSEGAGDD